MGELPMTYLELPLGSKFKASAVWNYTIERRKNGTQVGRLEEYLSLREAHFD